MKYDLYSISYYKKMYIIYIYFFIVLLGIYITIII